MRALLSVLDLFERGGETFCDRGLGLGAAALEALAELSERGWRDEEVDGVEVRRFYLADALRRVFGRTGRREAGGGRGRTWASMSRMHRLPVLWTSRTVMKLVP